MIADCRWALLVACLAPGVARAQQATGSTAAPAASSDADATYATAANAYDVAEAADAASSSDIVAPAASSPIGDLAVGCSVVQSPGICTFVPAESRDYVIDVVAMNCVEALTSITGAPGIRVTRDRQERATGCRIAQGRVRLSKDVAVTVTALSRNNRGGRIPVSLTFRKN